MWLIVFATLAGGTDIPEAVAPIATQAASARFQRIDRDHDGFITASEAPRIALSRGGGSASDSGGPSWIETYDADRDSRVSLAEFAARSLPAQTADTLTQR